MRRFLTACLFMVAAVALAAGPALAQGITWWEHSNPPHNKYSQELVAEWNKMHPNMKVQYEFFAMTPYFKKLSAALSTKSAADMFTVIDTLLPGFTTKNVLAPIRPGWLGYKDLDDMKKAFLPGALEGYIHEGKLYAVPPIASVFSLYINKNHFKEAGLDPEKDYPKTWEDIAKVGQKLVKRRGNTITREAFDFAMHSSAWTMWYMEALTRQHGGSILDAAGKKCTANSEAGVKAMEVRSMYARKHKISDPTVSVGTNALPADDVPKGRVSMFISHAGSVAQFGPKVMEHIKVVPFPQVNPAKPVSIVYGFALAVNPHVSEAKQKQVHDLIKHVMANPKQWYDKTSYPFPSANFLQLPGMDEARKTRYLDVFVGDIKTGVFVTRSPHFIEIADAMHRAMERVVLKGEAPKKSLDQACTDIDRALAKK
ncbi:MAG: extracellular solute-binding protein [Candidatus Tectomicrobia bacterium]|nr:extracellular solute-binding protein [Candidatus Tectomicrobia bacterium]